jgi:hypothetical protein
LKRKVAAKRIKQHSIKWRKAFWGVMLMLLSLSILLLYQKQISGVLLPSLQTLSSWTAKHKNKIVTKKSTHPSNNPTSQEPALHFEFYTALPSMQVKLPEIKHDIAVNNKAAVSADPYAMGESNSKSLSAIKHPIINAAELEHEFYQHLQQNTNTFPKKKKHYDT